MSQEVKRSKGFITAIAKEGTYGRGLPAGAPVLATFTGGAAQDVSLATTPVQEGTIEVVNTTTGTNLRLGVHYTIKVTNGETFITLLDGVAGLSAADEVSVTFGYWTDADVIQTDVGSYVTVEFETLERDTANGKFTKCPTILGTETVSGTITADLLITEDNTFDSHNLIECGMGLHIAGGANLFASTQATVPTPFDTDYVITLYGALSAADILVYVGIDATGTPLVLTTDYTVAFANGVATVTLLSTGTVAVAGDTIFVSSPNSYAISEVATLTGEGGLYKFSIPSDPDISLTSRQYIGGDRDAVRDSYGLVSDSINFNLPTGELAKVEIAVGGIRQEAALTEQAMLTAPGCSGDPFAVKRAVFLQDGVVVADASDLSFSAENTIADVSGVESDGTSRRVKTAKMFQGTFNALFRSNDAFNKFRSNTAGKIYFELENTAGDLFALYLPNVRYTSNDMSDADGLVSEANTVEAFDDELGNAVYVAVKYRA